MTTMLDKIPIHKTNGFVLHQLGLFREAAFDLVEMNTETPYPPHYHKHSKATFYIVLGEGIAIINGKEQAYKKGDVFDIPPGTSHGFTPTTRTLFLSIQKPPIKGIGTRNEDIHYISEKA